MDIPFGLEAAAERPPRGLIVFAHPALERARVGPALLAAAVAEPGFVVRDLYDLYPDTTIDVPAEQAALVISDFVVLQFPLYWYSAPSLLKEWLDLVWVHGWSHGRGARALKGKTLACAFSAGGPSGAYAPEGVNRFTITEFMRPWEQTAALCGMRWITPFVVHGVGMLNPATLEAEAARYGAWLKREAAIAAEMAR